MWLEILKQQVADRGVVKVAAELGYKNHTGLSLALNGKYPASTRKIETTVLKAYARVQCPFLAREITFAECSDFHTRAAPTSSPLAMRHWRACQGCPNRRES